MKRTGDINRRFVFIELEAVLLNFFVFLDKTLVRALNVIIIATSLIITALIIFLIITRVFGWSIVGLLELATISAMWLYMSGAIIAARNREHLVVDFVAQKIETPKVKAIHDLILAVFMIALGIFFMKLSFDMYEFSVRRPQTTPALSLPLMLPQFAIITGSIFLGAYALRDLISATIAFTKIFKNRGD